VKTPRVEPGAWAPGADGVPASTLYGDRYHPAGDPEAQARQVFLAGNGLPGRWAGQRHFTVLETGFGLGRNFLATWAAWAADPQRPARLGFVSIERHPLAADALARAWQTAPADASADAQGQARRAELLAAWPVATPDLHRLVLAEGRIELLLAFGDVRDWLPRLQVQADALFLDGFAPDRNPAMWDRGVMRGLARLGAPDVTLATWCTARAVRETLTWAGFEIQRVPGLFPKRQMTVGRRHPAAREAATRWTEPGSGQDAEPGSAPSTSPATSRATSPQPTGHAGPRHACIVGGGLAGCAAAIALVRAGWTVEMLEAAPTLAAGASGNPAGIFHGSVHPDDGPHARWSRAATLAAAREYARLIAQGQVPGAVDGLLRLEHEAPLPTMHERLQRLGLPAAHVRALAGPEAAAWSGGPPGLSAGWALSQAGWVVPAAVCRAWHAEAGGAWTFRGSTRVARLAFEAGAWQALDAAGHPLAAAPVMIVAAAARTVDLLAAHSDAATWPAGTVRGQVGWIHPAELLSPGPVRPIAGHGYAVTLPDGRLLFGATAQPGDPDPAARNADDRVNLARLAALGFVDGPTADREAEHWAATGRLQRRVGERWSVVDRLPLVGPVAAPRADGRFLPAPTAPSARSPGRAGGSAGDAPTGAIPKARLQRTLPRTPGLFVIGGFGSRGLTAAPLAGALLAARLDGRPWPVERPVADRLDPGRFALARQLASAGVRTPDDA
jgi:tRNA 5-methylaminomethyl-2-thiouridine biosynthesis bifunctional protein